MVTLYGVLFLSHCLPVVPLILLLKVGLLWNSKCTILCILGVLGQ